MALWLFGPSAVGKTTIRDAVASQLFGSAENAVEVDGALFRDEHAGWQSVAQHGYATGMLHEEAWGIFKKHSGSSKLKKRIIASAIEARQNMIIPDTMNAPDKVEELMSQLRNAGFALHAVCLWAPLVATRRRGEPRSVREGKLWSPADYAVSTRGTLAMAQRFAAGMHEHPDVWHGFSCWDNSVFPSTPVSLETFASLSVLDEVGAEEHHRRLQHQSQRRVARLSFSATPGALHDRASDSRRSGLLRSSTQFLSSFVKSCSSSSLPTSELPCSEGGGGGNSPLSNGGCATSDVEAASVTPDRCQATQAASAGACVPPRQAFFGTPGGLTLSEQRQAARRPLVTRAPWLIFGAGGLLGVLIGALAAALIGQAMCDST